MRKARTAEQQEARDYIEANWQTMSDSTMSEFISFGRKRSVTRNSVAHIRKRLGLVRDDENIKTLHSRGRNKIGWRRK